MIVKGLALLLTDKIIAINLGPTDFGIYKYFLTLLIIFSSFSSFGFGSSIVRFISINRSNNIYLYSLIRYTVVRVVFACIFFIIISQFHYIYSIFKVNYYFSIIIVSLLGISINVLLIGVYSGLGLTFGKSIVNDFIGSLIWIITIFIYSFLEISLLGLCYLYFFYNIFMLVVNLIYLKIKNVNIYNILLSKEYISLVEFKRYSWPIYLTLIFVTLGLHYDKMILAQFVDKYTLGIYFSATIIPAFLLTMLTTINFLYFPKISSVLANKKNKFFSYITSFTTKWISFIAFIVTYFLFFHAYDIIIMFFNEKFLIAETCFKILSLSQFIHLSFGFTGQNILALGKSKVHLLVKVFSLLLGMVMGLLFVEKWGIEGIAFSVLIMSFVSNMIQIYYMQIILKYRLFFLENYLTWISSFFLFLLTYVLNFLNNSSSSYFQSILFIVIFILILITTNVISRKDIKMLKFISDIE